MCHEDCTHMITQQSHWPDPSHDCHVLELEWHWEQLSPTCRQRSLRRLATIDGQHTNRHPPYSLAPLYHTMFHVTCVYKLAVGGTIQVPQSVNQSWLMSQDTSLCSSMEAHCSHLGGSGNQRADASWSAPMHILMPSPDTLWLLGTDCEPYNISHNTNGP